jgi:hypothetical protein
MLVTDTLAHTTPHQPTLHAAGGGKAQLSRGEKKRLKAAREAEIRAAEAARLADGQAVESAVDYEQQLLAAPSNSYLWIKFMAFQLKLGEFVVGVFLAASSELPRRLGVVVAGPRAVELHCSS